MPRELRCDDLDEDSHELMRCITRARWHPKTGTIKGTAWDLSEQTQIPFRTVKMLLGDLEEDDWISLTRNSLGDPTGAIVGLSRCTCEPTVPAPSAVPLGSAADDHVPTRGDDEGRGVGGSLDGLERRRSRQGTTHGHAHAREPRRAPEVMRPRDLAEYFDRKMAVVRATSSGWGSVGNTNRAALMKHFSRWIREDNASPAQIVAMIDVFAGDTRLLREALPAWQVFLSRRELLVQRARRLVESRTAEVEGWDDSGGDADDDDLGWD